MLTRLGVMSLLFTMVIIGRAVAKRFQFNIHELIFSRPVSKIEYLGGRFFGAFVANLLIFAGIVLGFEVGITFLEPQYSGPFRIGSYLLPVVFIIIATCS